MARHAAEIPAGVAGFSGKFTAFVVGADIPALLRKGAKEELGWQLDFSRDPLVFLKHGAKIPIRVNRMGRYFLSVVDFGKDATWRVCCPAASASFRRRKDPGAAGG